ncbi:hypothetical protein BCR44DRAFT_1517454 [Catenaria anguillulae PL171]|uniref:Uncharacterized protein n=1 Tax=Catenaria anguillulae PL171 TaxID=765915 RepID=A0A1Y2H6B3_9FUNG|nr:hypothetical protein BCR44DRAFT_1517454 [Catenaria anguillulae PL171]
MDTTKNDDATPDLHGFSYGPPLPCTGDPGGQQISAQSGFGSPVALDSAGLGLTMDDLLDMDAFCSGAGVVVGDLGIMGGNIGMAMDVDVGPVSFSTVATTAPLTAAAIASTSPLVTGDQQRNNLDVRHQPEAMPQVQVDADAFNLTSRLPLDLDPPLPPLPPTLPYFHSPMSTADSLSQPLPHPSFCHSSSPAYPPGISSQPHNRPSTAPSTSSSSFSTNISTSPSSIPRSPTPESICSSSSSTISDHSAAPSYHPSPAIAPAPSAIDYRFTTFSPIASPVQAASRPVSPPPAWDLQDSHPPSAFFPAAAAAAAAAASAPVRQRRSHVTDGEWLEHASDSCARLVVERVLDEKRRLLELLYTRFTASEIHTWAYSANISLSTNANDPLYSLAPRHSTSLPSPPVSIATSTPMSPASTLWSQPLCPPTTAFASAPAAPPPPPVPPSLIIRIRKPLLAPTPSASDPPAPTPTRAHPPTSQVLARCTYSNPTATAAALDDDDDSDALSSLASDYEATVAARARPVKRAKTSQAARGIARAAKARRKRQERTGEYGQRWVAVEDGAAVARAARSSGGAGAGRHRGGGRRGTGQKSKEAQQLAAAKGQLRCTQLQSHALESAALSAVAAARGAERQIPPAPGRGRGRARRETASMRRSNVTGSVHSTMDPVPTATSDTVSGLTSLPHLNAPALKASAADAVKPNALDASAKRKRRVTQGDLGIASHSKQKKRRQRRASGNTKSRHVDGGLADVDDEDEVVVDVVRLEHLAVDSGPVPLLGPALEYPFMRLPTPPPDIFRSRGLPALLLGDALAAAARVQPQGQRSNRARRRQQWQSSSSTSVCLSRNVRATVRSVQLTPPEQGECVQILQDEEQTATEPVGASDRAESTPPMPTMPSAHSRLEPTPSIHNDPHAQIQPEVAESTPPSLSSYLSVYMSSSSSSSRPSTPSTTSSRAASPSPSPVAAHPTSAASSITAALGETPLVSLGTRWTRADRLLLCTQWLAATDPGDLVARLSHHFPTRSKRACRHQLDDLIHGRVTCEGVDVEALKNRKVRGYADPRYEGMGGAGGGARRRGGKAPAAVRGVVGEGMKQELGGAANPSQSPRKPVEIVVMVPPVQARHLQVLRKRLSSMTQVQNETAAQVKIAGAGAGNCAAGNALGGVIEDGIVRDLHEARAVAQGATEDVMTVDVSKETGSAAPELRSIQENPLVDAHQDGMLVDGDSDESRPILELVDSPIRDPSSGMQPNPSPNARPLTPAPLKTRSEAPYNDQDQAADGHVAQSEPNVLQGRSRSPLSLAKASSRMSNSSPLPTSIKDKKQNKGLIRPSTAPPTLPSVSSSASSRATRPAAASSSPTRPAVVVEQHPHPFSVTSLLSGNGSREATCTQDQIGQPRDGAGPTRSTSVLQALLGRALRWDR